MTEERAAIVEAFVDAWNRRDIAAALELVGDDFEYVNPPNAMEPGTRRGADGVTDVMSKQWEALGDDARLEIDRTHHRDELRDLRSPAIPGDAGKHRTTRGQGGDAVDVRGRSSRPHGGRRRRVVV